MRVEFCNYVLARFSARKSKWFSALCASEDNLYCSVGNKILYTQLLPFFAAPYHSINLASLVTRDVSIGVWGVWWIIAAKKHSSVSAHNEKRDKLYDKLSLSPHEIYLLIKKGNHTIFFKELDFLQVQLLGVQQVTHNTHRRLARIH